MAEINPLVVTKDGQVLALDAKINFDDNALYRHPAFAELRDLNEEEPLEVEASKYNLNYIKLDGAVAAYNPPEDVDQDGLDILVGKQNLKPVLNRFGTGGPAHVQKSLPAQSQPG